MSRKLRLAVAPMSLVILFLAACSKDKPSPIQPLTGVAPDFSLVDVNPNSASTGQAVSPRQYTNKISAWYFGHAT